MFVAGMITHFILTGGQHPFGNEATTCEANIQQGKLCIEKERLGDPTELSLDLILWMLPPRMEARKNAEECIRYV